MQRSYHQISLSFHFVLFQKRKAKRLAAILLIRKNTNLTDTGNNIMDGERYRDFLGDEWGDSYIKSTSKFV